MPHRPQRGVYERLGQKAVVLPIAISGDDIGDARLKLDRMRQRRGHPSRSRQGKRLAGHELPTVVQMDTLLPKQCSTSLTQRLLLGVNE